MTEQEDPFQSEEFAEWMKDVTENMVPKMVGAEATISLLPLDGPDPKFAVELGYSIMLNKPIIVIREPGQVLPPGLEKVADVVIDLTREELFSADPETQTRISQAVDVAIKVHK